MRIANCTCVEHIRHTSQNNDLNICKGSLKLKSVHQHHEEDEANWNRENSENNERAETSLLIKELVQLKYPIVNGQYIMEERV